MRIALVDEAIPVHEEQMHPLTRYAPHPLPLSAAHSLSAANEDAEEEAERETTGSDRGRDEIARQAPRRRASELEPVIDEPGIDGVSLGLGDPLDDAAYLRIGQAISTKKADEGRHLLDIPLIRGLTEELRRLPEQHGRPVHRGRKRQIRHQPYLAVSSDRA